MKKTNELVKLPNTTMYFPKVELTDEEILRMYQGYIRPGWMKVVVINQNDVERLWNSVQRPPKFLVLERFIEQYQNDEHLWNDIVEYSNGNMDMIDLSVKYGIYYKELQKTLKQCFPDRDVTSLWKAHKKHAQKQTSKTLYGTEHPSLSAEVKAKRDATMMERYGVTHNMQSPQLRKRHTKRFLEKHGVRYAFEINERTENWYKTLFDTLSTPIWRQTLQTLADENDYAVEPYMFRPEKLDIKRRDFSMSYQSTENLESLLTRYKQISGGPAQYPEDALFAIPITNFFSKPWLKHFHKLGLIEINETLYQQYSQFERMVAAKLEQNEIEYIANNRTILGGLELDFYLPEYNVGIECNPNKTHNSNKHAVDTNRNMFGVSVKSTNYHYDKYKKAKDLGIRLIQWFEVDLEPLTFESITFPRFLTTIKGCSTKIGARKVVIKKETKPKVIREFIEQYHARGCTPASEYWGFYHQDNLIGAASFVIKNGEVELKRLCFKTNVQIVGGISKLIKSFFTKHPDVSTVKTFSDNDLGDGNGYKQAGAEFVGETGPSLKFVSWSDPTDTYSWQIATTWGANSGVVAKLSGNQTFTNRSEIEKYIELEMPHRTDEKCGYDRIYTSGSKRWQFTRQTFNEHLLVGE